jgi:hypothetical protein
METQMKKEILHEKVYYYENGVKNFEELMKNIHELDEIDNPQPWENWTASNDKDFIYGKTMSFDKNQIGQMEDPYKSRMTYIFDTIMESFYDVSKDFATSIGDNDEPRLFPVFNIKKYRSGIGMGAHFDQLDGDQTLRYSLVMYLNDDFEGGEISFKLSDYKNIGEFPSPDLDYDVAVSKNEIDFGLKPKSGSIIIFPSSAPYHHTAHIVKTGFKYMVPSHWIHNNMELNRSQSM